jgi:ABC-type amino acid transport substrate-binding protein
MSPKVMLFDEPTSAPRPRAAPRGAGGHAPLGGRWHDDAGRHPREGIDADLAKEFAKQLDAELEIVESGFSTFIADLQADKCDIGMFGVGATLKRAQAVEFSKPYLITNIYAITRKLDGPLMQYAKKHKLDPIVAP